MLCDFSEEFEALGFCDFGFDESGFWGLKWIF